MSMSMGESRLMLGGGDEAYVIATATHNGSQVCMCISANTGQFYGWCPVVFWGGSAQGTSHLPIRLPSATGGEPDISQFPQVFVVYRSGDRPPVVVGLLSAGGGDGSLLDSNEQPDQDSDNSDATLSDLRLANSGSAIALKDNTGNIVVMPRNHAFVGLPEKGEFRIVRDGDDTGRVPLAAPVVDYLEQLRSTLDSLIAWTRVAAVPTGGTLTPPFVGEAPPVPSIASLAASAIKVPSKTEYDFDFTPDF